VTRSRPTLRGLALPLFVEGDNLVVRGGDGDSTRLPLTGDGAVAALSPYRYSTSTRSVERGQGSHFWWWVGKWRRGQPSPAHSVTTETDASMSLPAEAGFSAGKWRRWTFDLTVEWGVAALDRNGDVLLRMRPLRNLRQMRRFAQASGLAFVEEQLTDPDRLGRAPEVITSRAAFLGKGTRRAINAVSFVLAGGVGLATYAALARNEFDNPTAAVPAALAFVACRGLFGWLLGRSTTWIVARFRD
jgi:hypothetical protein